MNIHSKPLTKPMGAILVALGVVACTTSPMRASEQAPTPTSAQLAEQRLASINRARVQEADYLNGLAISVKEEKRDDAWAAQEESALRSSYATERHDARGGLMSVDCRSSRCDLQIQLSAAQSPEAAVEQQAAITKWIASSQPCGYTIVPALDLAAAPAVMRIYLDCGQNSQIPTRP